LVLVVFENYIIFAISFYGGVEACKRELFFFFNIILIFYIYNDLKIHWTFIILTSSFRRTLVSLAKLTSFKMYLSFIHHLTKNISYRNTTIVTDGISAINIFRKIVF